MPNKKKNNIILQQPHFRPMVDWICVNNKIDFNKCSNNILNQITYCSSGGISKLNWFKEDIKQILYNTDAIIDNEIILEIFVRYLLLLNNFSSFLFVIKPNSTKTEGIVKDFNTTNPAFL